jgi:hypothetical protein
MIKNNIYRDDGYCLNIFNNVRSQQNLDLNLAVEIDKNRLDLKNKFTIEMRANLKFIAGTFHYLFTIRYQTGGSQGFNLRAVNATTLTCTYTDSTSTSRSINNSNFTLNTWNHVVVVFDLGNRISIYINGIKSEITTNISLAGNQVLDIYAHRGVDANNWNFIGQSKGIRIYDGHAATDSEVTEMYNSDSINFQKVPTSMQSFLKREHIFSQRNGNRIKDTSPINAKSAKLTAGFKIKDTLPNGNAWKPINP